MSLPASLTWEVRTTGNANNGGAYTDLIPGTSIDYSQQNASQLSKADLASAAASVTLTSVTGGFTAGMVGNVIQIRAGGVNFVAGFYEIVLFNSVNSVNLDRTPNSGNATGGLGEVGGALISPGTFILNGVPGNLCYVKSGTYNFAASITFAAANTTIFGYDTARNVIPTGNNRPLFTFGAFFLSGNSSDKLTIRNIRFTGSAVQIFSIGGHATVFINCYFENTNNAGTRSCIVELSTKHGHTIMDCEFCGTPGADSRGVTSPGVGIQVMGICFLFNFFHDLNFGFYSTGGYAEVLFFKNIFARMGQYSIYITGGGQNEFGVISLFNSYYSAGVTHINSRDQSHNLIYGNTFDSAVVVALLDSVVSRMWNIENNDFWNNGILTLNCFLGLDNIGLNPLWVNPLINDFNFSPGSPNINQALGIKIGV